MTQLLQIQNMHVSYGNISAVNDISIQLDKGGVVSIIGPNGAGKSSFLNGVMGIIPAKGRVLFNDVDLSTHSTEEKVEQGLCLVPETRALFYGMTVSDNLDLGAFYYRNDRSNTNSANKEWVLNLFPRLRERLQQLAGTMSGGEQQMLALGRALMGRPKVLMLDEPSLGLAPMVVNEIFESIEHLKQEKDISLIIVEQNARLAMRKSDYCYVIEGGKVILEGTSDALAADERVQSIYLGMQG